MDDDAAVANLLRISGAAIVWRADLVVVDRGIAVVLVPVLIRNLAPS